MEKYNFEQIAKLSLNFVVKKPIGKKQAKKHLNNIARKIKNGKIQI